MTSFGRIFANWAFIYFGQFLENFRSSPHSTATFSRDARYLLILTEEWVGQHFGLFFLNSSSHPGNISYITDCVNRPLAFEKKSSSDLVTKYSLAIVNVGEGVVVGVGDLRIVEVDRHVRDPIERARTFQLELGPI
jgi:hypothetical protein